MRSADRFFRPFRTRATHFAALGAIAIVCAAVGCSGGGTSVLAPQRHVAPTATPTATPFATPSPGSTSAAAIATANASLSNVQTMYAALPHVSSSADLATLASQMVASGQFKTAVVSPGGISATLPNGSPALVFADHIDDPTGATPGPNTSNVRNARGPRRQFGSYSGKPDTIAVLVNNSDTSGAFTPQNQANIAYAISASGFENSQYGVDLGDVELESFDSIGSAGSVDVLDLSTHGMVEEDNYGDLFYAWLSDTPISGNELGKYASDYRLGTIEYAVEIGSKFDRQALIEPTFAFTPSFVTRHTHFSPGAIMINQSCHGQNSYIAASVRSTLQAGGIGRYYGWDTAVRGYSADQTDAFIWDRLLGEGTTILSQFVTQRVPAQRPFDLDDIDTVLSTEQRSPRDTSDFDAVPSMLTYAQTYWNDYNPDIGNFVISDFGGESNASPPVEYFIPSISYVAVTEDRTNPTLTIYGKFPPQAGTVQIIDPNQTSSTPITPTTWATDHITVPIAQYGLGSKGNVVVSSQYGIASNAVALTQWTGTLAGTEDAAWTSMNGSDGNGSGTISSSFTIDFRADVHPTVPDIDASPVPQNLAFTQVENDSTGQVTSVTGFFATGDGKHNATFGMGPNVSPLTVGLPPLSNTFNVAAISGQPAQCNDGSPGANAGPTNVFCPILGFRAVGAGTCTDDAGTLCTSATWDVTGTIGAPNGTDGQLVFTMDPNTYAITVSSTSPNTPAALFEATPQLSGGITGTINAPVAPPNTMTPASRTRARRQR